MISFKKKFDIAFFYEDIQLFNFDNENMAFYINFHKSSYRIGGLFYAYSFLIYAIWNLHHHLPLLQMFLFQGLNFKEYSLESFIKIGLFQLTLILTISYLFAKLLILLNYFVEHLDLCLNLCLFFLNLTNL